MTSPQRSKALARFKVIDLTRVRSGPTCVRQFADWGADVIMVEMPESLTADSGGMGAREGSFQPERAWDSAASERFFGELRQARKSGYFVVEDHEQHGQHVWPAVRADRGDAQTE